MKSRLAAIAYCAATLLGSVSVLSQSPANQVMQLHSKSEPIPIGQSGSLKLQVQVKEGFKIPKKPAPKLSLNPRPEFEIKGDLRFTEEGQPRDPEYFGKFRNLSLEITPAAGVKPGRYSLGAKFVYFYCSEKDKYCSRAAQDVEFPFEIAPAP